MRGRVGTRAEASGARIGRLGAERRAFVELRRVAGSFQELQERLDQMELDIGARLSEHDEQLRQIFEALRQLIAPPPKVKRPVGFRVREGDE
jgi:hypothetical protein